ncbi:MULTISPECIES: hypothetical protein [unclassified Archaeoglobus]|uniref:hypothetical protein n=1 Tax=unclassified Archaeoglobus TaxID=2643606 RepID=UPI0025C50D72|nr:MULTISPECIES: hypothetical protein [unclassified Archaeoglobus]
MDVEVAEEYRTFAKVVRISTIAGLIVLIASSVMYLLDIDPFVEPDRVVETWHLPASEFWKVNVGKEMESYSEFLYIEHPDTIAVFSLFILALTPVLGLLSILPKLKGIYRILALLVISELLFGAVRPLILGAFGE